MKKILITLCIIFILIPIILIVGIKAYLEITKQIDYSKNKKVVYDYINQEYGKEFAFIQVEKENWDFWTLRTDTFYFKDNEKDFVFEIAVENQEITHDTYNENKLGKEIEKEFYKTLPKDVNLDFIFSAESYAFENEKNYSDAYSTIIVFYDTKIKYEEIYKLFNYIKNKFKDINIRLLIYNKSYKEDYIRILNKEIGYDDVEIKPLYSSINLNEKLESFEEFMNIIDEKSKMY